MSYYLNTWNYNLALGILFIKLLDVSNTWLVEGILFNFISFYFLVMNCKLQYNMLYLQVVTSITNSCKNVTFVDKQ